jgi:hypothetical protein
MYTLASLAKSLNVTRSARPLDAVVTRVPLESAGLNLRETVRHLIRFLESRGVGTAPAIAPKHGSKASTARDLCYRLCVLSDLKKRATSP